MDAKFLKTSGRFPAHRFLLLTLICTLCVMPLSGCTLPQETTPISRSGFYFDTVITITVYDEQDAKALDTCFALADRYEHLFSTKIPESDVARIR